MPTQRALITGASGFVGSHLARHLLGEDWQVHAIVRPESDRAALTRANGLRVHEYTGSMDSMLSILGIVKPDAVFHLASLFVSEHDPEDIDRLVKSNILFGTQLAEAMSQVGANLLVNTGTAWQHYEADSYNPVNLYAATKQAFEDLLDYYIEGRGLRAITLKLHDTYGPGDSRKKLINLLVSVAKSNITLDMSPGEQKLNLVYIDDVVSAFEVAAKRLLNNPEIKQESFSVEAAETCTIKQLVSEFEAVVGRPLPISWAGRPYRQREVMEPWAGAGLPNWEPRVDLRFGLRRMLGIIGSGGG
ncbi:NAD(P)-dependent oxidoreductase [Spiribacter sp. 1M153]|uniref:NAD-dependent epimerase/dehydratase family protein n=1 Tax=Spiribacter roseus TaxID=1855875 RepID=UPI00349F80B4